MYDCLTILNKIMQIKYICIPILAYFLTETLNWHVLWFKAKKNLFPEMQVARKIFTRAAANLFF